MTLSRTQPIHTGCYRMPADGPFPGEHRYSHELALAGEPDGAYPDWIARFQELDPWRVYFAHDRAVWQKDVAGDIV